MSSSAGEEPDAIGWRSGVSILVECKTSLADFKRDSKKWWRRVPNVGMGNWRFYLCPKNVIKPEDLPLGWGLIYQIGKKAKMIIGQNGNTAWGKPPFESNRRNEILLLVSALSRTTTTGEE
jgi:hypothetical protein